MTNEPVKNELASIPKFKKFEDGMWGLPDGTDVKSLTKQLMSFMGSHDRDAFYYLINQLVYAVEPNNKNTKMLETVNQVTPLLRAIAPRDELEGMLAVQMIGIHNMSMEMMKRAMLSGQTIECVNFNVNRVTKLSRTFITQLEALNKHRGKGTQKITVEHVTVNDGGQAIVGNVEHGGRDEKKK